MSRCAATCVLWLLIAPVQLYGAPDDAAPQPFGWHELPGTSIASVCPPNGFDGSGYPFADKCRFVTEAWSSGAFDTRRNRLYVLGGGHNDYYGNEVYAIDLEARRAVRVTDPAPVADPDAEPRQSELAPFDHTQPNSRHTYDGVVYIEHADRLWMFSGALAGRAASGNRDNLAWEFDPARETWRRMEPRGDVPGAVTGVMTAYDPETGLVFLHDRQALYSYEYAPGGGIFRRLAGGAVGLGVNAAIDPEQRLFVIVGGGQFITYDLNPDSGYARREPAPLGDSDIVDAPAPGLDYHPELHQLIGWAGDNRIFRLDLATSTWSVTAHHGGPSRAALRGTYGRWAYAAGVDAFVVYNTVDGNAYTYRPMAESKDETPPASPAQPTVATPYLGSVVLRWEPPRDNVGIAGYRVYRDGALVAEPHDPVFRELGLTPGTRVEYRVAALDSAGNESPRSAAASVVPPASEVALPLGDCGNEERLRGRRDVVFCEPWEDADWWEAGYLNDPIVADPRRARESDVERTRIVGEGCVAGRCLRIDTPRGVTKSLSLYWPLKHAGLAPETLYMRYYLKLGPDWGPFMCKKDGTRAGAGGKFPGPADVRTWADPGKQCGNGGKPGNGIDCWSARSSFRQCASRDGRDCATKPDAVARFGSYVYHARQAGGTGDAGFWDGHGYGSSRGGGGTTCESSPRNLVCGRGDGGVLVPERWYRIEIQTTMNTPGEEDGIIRGWVDGVLSYEKTNTVFREPGHDLLHNRLAWLNVYKGGMYGNCQDGAVFLDQLVLATEAPPGGLDARTTQPPTITLTGDSAAGTEEVRLSWQADDAATCSASGLWSGDKPLRGEAVVSVPAAGGEARLTCKGPGGSSARAWLAPASREAVKRAYVKAVAERSKGTQVPLAPPKELTVAQLPGGRVSLHWTPAAAAERYRVYLNALLIAIVAKPEFELPRLPRDAEVELSVASVGAGRRLSAPSAPLRVTIDPPPDAAVEHAGATLRADFAAVSDTFLAPSTRSPLGTRPSLLVNGKHSALVAFPFALPRGAEVRRAVLHLTSTHQYSELRLGVFVPAKDWHETGVTHYESDTFTEEAWEREGGDWTDASGRAHGERPYAELALPKRGEAFDVRVDVTTAVQAWQRGGVPNRGLFLRSMSAAGSGHRFASTDGAGQGPHLVVDYVVP